MTDIAQQAQEWTMGSGAWCMGLALAHIFIIGGLGMHFVDWMARRKEKCRQKDSQ